MNTKMWPGLPGGYEIKEHGQPRGYGAGRQRWLDDPADDPVILDWETWLLGRRYVRSLEAIAATVSP